MKDTDRELLEMAARAMWADEYGDVGIRWGELDQCILYIHADNQDHNGADREYRWHPLDENADAFELAAKLKLDVLQDTSSVTIKKWCSTNAEATDLACEKTDGCRIEATRLAIVRAAAEIGKSMK